MAPARLRIISLVLIAVSLLFSTRPSQAQTSFDIGPSKGQVVGAAVGAIAAITVISVSLYFVLREPRITGCVTAGPDGSLAIQGNNASDPLYMLQNAPPTLQAGQRVKVLGHKKKNADKTKTLVVARVASVYGACSPSGATAHAMLDVPVDPLETGAATP